MNIHSITGNTINFAAEGVSQPDRERTVFNSTEFGAYLAHHGTTRDAGDSCLVTNACPPPQFADQETELQYLRARVSQLEAELDGVSNKGKLIAQELDLFRQRRVVFWSDRFRNAFDAWNLMNSNFQQLKDDSAIFHGGIHSLRLQPSLSLLRVPFLSYNFRLSRPGLSGVLLAPVLDVPLQVGELCVRIFSAPDNLLASCSKSVTAMSDEEPVLFDFEPIPNSHEVQLSMRVYVQGVDAPVRIFELRRYALGGFGKLQSRPFVGYQFEHSSA